MNRNAREELRPPIRRTKGPGKSLGGVHGPLLMANQQVKSLAGEARSLDDAGLSATGGVEDFFADVHNINGKDILHRVKGHIPGLGKEFVYHSGMAIQTQDPWLQRPRFRALVDAWIKDCQDGETVTQKRAALSIALGLGPASLKQYYSGRQVPGRNLMAKIVSVLGCSPSDLMDDASQPPTGVDAQAWQESDEDARTFANIMFHEAKDLSPEQRKAILDMVRAGRALGQQRRESGD